MYELTEIYERETNHDNTKILLDAITVVEGSL